MCRRWKDCKADEPSASWPVLRHSRPSSLDRGHRTRRSRASRLQSAGRLHQRARGAEQLHRAGVNYAAFIVTGALYVAFAAALGATFAGRWRYAVAAAFVALEGIGRIGAGVYACDPG